MRIHILPETEAAPMYNITYDVIALIIDTVLLVTFSLSNRFTNRKSRTYYAMVIMVMLVTIFDIMWASLGAGATPERLGLLYAFDSLYFFGLNSINVLLYLYLITIIRKDGLTRFDHALIVMALVGYAVLIFPSFLTHAIFYFDGTLTYTHGPLFLLLPAISCIFTGILLYLTVQNRSKLTKLQFQLNFAFTFLVTLSIIHQIVNPSLLMIPFALSLMLIVTYLTLENPDRYYNHTLKCLSKEALRETLAGNVEEQRPFVAVVVKIEDFDYINKVFGTVRGNDILVSLSSSLVDAAGFKATYHHHDANFVLVVEPGRFATLREVAALTYPRTYAIDDREIVITPSLFAVGYPDVVSTLAEVVDTIQYGITHSNELVKRGQVEATPGLIDEMYHEATMNQVISRAIEQGNLEVYFQPIYDQAAGRVTGAEALVRINDPTIGVIGPQDFIHIAEGNERIIEIGTTCFRQVCEFLVSDSASRFDILFIDFNLSAAECLDLTLADRLIAEMDRHGVSHDMLRFEVREEVLLDDSVISNLMKLYDSGCEFVINDFGTGISNTRYLINLPYRYTKIDKLYLWKALGDERAMIILRNAIKMMWDLGRIVLVEGVETEEQHRLLLSLGILLQQGFYFSKPVARTDYVKFLETYRYPGNATTEDSAGFEEETKGVREAVPHRGERV